MSQWHSIWLVPSRDDLPVFETVVKKLADRFGTQRFIPHLTLVEDMERSADDLASVLEARFAGEAAISAPIADVDGLPLFFRSLYARFEPMGPLRDLKARAIDAFGIGDIDSFMPHVSLAYGASDEQKTSAFEALRQALTGRTIRFDQIAVVASAQSIPIEDWKIVHAHKLV